MEPKSILQSFAEDQNLMDAVKEIVLKYFAEVPYAEGASDELLGQLTRARVVGRQKVEAAFREIASMKVVKTSGGDKENPAY